MRGSADTLTPTRALALLRAAGIEAPERELRLLLAHARSLAGRPAYDSGSMPDPFADLLARRLAREPLAFIRGYREFWGLRFAVSRATLIPRPESETLVEAALAAFPDRDRPLRVLDLGTGTGCLLLSLLSEFPRSSGVGVDRVSAAAELARGNARSLRLADRALFLVGDWGASLAGVFDLILANPPYVATAAIPSLMPEIPLYEPTSALDGGADGLDAYRSLFAGLSRLLVPAEGIAVIELGAGALRAVSALARSFALTVRAVRPDLARVPRALVLSGCHEKTVWHPRRR